MDRSQCRVGMNVVGSDGDGIGQVKECRNDDFLVSRALQVDMYVPYGAVQTVTAEAIVLSIPAGKVEGMGWPRPPSAGAPPTSPGGTPPAPPPD